MDLKEMFKMLKHPPEVPPLNALDAQHLIDAISEHPEKKKFYSTGSNPHDPPVLANSIEYNRFIEEGLDNIFRVLSDENAICLIHGGILDHLHKQLCGSPNRNWDKSILILIQMASFGAQCRDAIVKHDMLIYRLASGISCSVELFWMMLMIVLVSSECMPTDALSLISAQFVRVSRRVDIPNDFLSFLNVSFIHGIERVEGRDQILSQHFNIQVVATASPSPATDDADHVDVPIC